MKSLVVWLNRIISKHKALKRWKRIVTVLAAIMTFVTTYALILPAITVEKEHTDKVAGMYLEQEGTQDDLLEENALEFTGVSIAADQENAVTYEYADDDMTAVAVFSTEEEIPEGAELVVNPVDTESEKYTEFSNRAALLLDSEFIYDVTTCSFYDFALICDGVDVTPKTGLVDVQINFLSNTVSHAEDVVYAGRFGRAAEAEDSFVAMAADITGETADTLAGSAEDELVSSNPDESSVIELSDGIITVLSLKGNNLAQNDSIVGVLAGYVDEEAKAAAAETDAEVPTVDDIQEETSALEVKTLKAAGEDYTVTLTYDETSGIPDGASLAVSEIAQNTKEYKTYLEKTKKVMGLTEEETLPKYAARFFDIKIMAGNKEFKPESGVSVEITYAEPLAENPETEVSAVHFENKKAKAEVIEANASGVQEDGAATVEFTAESFSVYGVIYTVDFYWEVNGKVYEFSMPGGGFLSFEALMEVMGIADGNSVDTSDDNGQSTGRYSADALSINDIDISDTTRKFVENVENVAFSSPELVWIGKIDHSVTVGEIIEKEGLEVQYSADLTEEQIRQINSAEVRAGDWALISMLPFDTQEALTVTMKDGETFTILVTDDQENPYGLSGKEFVIANTKNGTNSAMTAQINNNRLVGQNINNGGTAPGWEFEWTGTGKEYLIHRGSQYLVIDGTDQNGRLKLTTKEEAESNPIVIGQKEGKYSFQNRNGLAINNYGGNFWVRSYDENNSDNWMTLQRASNVTLPNAIATADTSDGITINLFNYGPENKLDDVTNHLTGTQYSDGLNSHQLKFWSYGDIGDTINHFSGDSSPQQNIVLPQLQKGTDGRYYPVINPDANGASSEESLQYLFSAGDDNVTPYLGLNHLFTKDEFGYYRYNSDENYAYFDTGNNNKNFTIYSKTFPEEGADEKYFGVGFYPFNDYNEYYNCIHGKGNNFQYWSPHTQGTNKAGHYDHHFGMELTANFVYTPGGYYNGLPINYHFSGDDDMWVFVDGVLILDIGGIHNPADGDINFSTGDVSVNGVPQTNLRDKYKQVTGKDWDDSDFSTHEMKVFYMERGGMYSNLQIEFNLPIFKTITFTKELRGLSDKERAKYSDEDFNYELLIDNGLYNGNRTIRRDANGDIIDRDFMIKDGQFTLKDGESLTITHLKRTDTFYVAEEDGLNMDQFYVPHAERYYYDNDKVFHEDEVDLEESVSAYDTHISDWRTPEYSLQNTEEVVFTNTLREKNLDVEKKWNDQKDHSNDEVNFKVKAHVLRLKDGTTDEYEEVDYYDAISAYYTGNLEGQTYSSAQIEDVLSKTYTLDAANNWKAQLEHLPAVTNHDLQISYEVVEVETAAGYHSSISGRDTHNIDVQKIFPLDHVFTDETITFRLKKGNRYYNESTRSWVDDAAQAETYTLSPGNDFVHRFHDMPGTSDDPAGSYSYEEIGDTNTNTEGLSIFDRKLKDFEILNSPFNVEVGKDWEGVVPEDESIENSKIEVTLGRYVLLDCEGNLNIIKNGIPSDANVIATYTVKNVDTDEVIGEYPYIPGGFTIKVKPGRYSVTENIIEDDPTFISEHGTSTVSVSVPEDDTETAIFTSSYTPITQKLHIKSTLTANGSGVDYSNVAYQIKDAKGTVVDTVSFSDASQGDGAERTLRIGKYYVEEINRPASDPAGYIGSFDPITHKRIVLLSADKEGLAEFNAEYNKKNTKTRLVIDGVFKGNNVAKVVNNEYKPGDIVRIHWNQNNGEQNVSVSVTGGTIVTNKTKESDANAGNNWTEGWYADVRLDDNDCNFIISTDGYTYGGRNDTYINGSAISVTTVSIAKALHMNARPPRGASTRDSDTIDIDLPAVDDPVVSVPDAPPGKKYVEVPLTRKDPETLQDVPYVVELTYGHWSKVLNDLPSVDANGNPYYYYIKSVHETGLPKGTEGQIILDDSHHKLVGRDTDDTKLSVKNVVGKTDVVVEKVWENIKGQRIEWPADSELQSISVQLQRSSDGGTTFEPVEGKTCVLTPEQQQFTFVGVDKYYDPDEKLEYLYSVIETTDPTGFTPRVERDDDIVRIINKANPEKITIGLQKIWQNGDGQPAQEHPDQITYDVYRVKHIHKMSPWETTKEPTEEEDGLAVSHCLHEGCSYTEEQILAKLEHTHDWEEVVIAPTCTEPGYTMMHCKKDESHDYRVEGSETEPLGHKFELAETVPATCTSEGNKHYICGRDECDASYDEPIPKLDHPWEEWVIIREATTEEPGLRQHTCSVCGTVEQEEIPLLKNYYKGTDIPLDDVVWPINGGTVHPSGIFTYNGSFWIIKKEHTLTSEQASGGPGGAMYSWNETISLDPYKNTIYTPESFGNGRRSDMKEGDLYHASNGDWYVYANRYSVYSDDPFTQGSVDNWYKIPVTNTQNNASSNSPQATGRMARRLYGAPQKAIVTEPVSSSDPIMTKINEMIGRVGYTDPATQEVFKYYTVDLYKENQTLSTTGDGPWTAEFEVEKTDNDGNLWTYYIVEKNLDSDYELVSYTGEDDGLTQGEKAVITNKKNIKAEITVKKVDAEKAKNNVADRYLAGAKFSLVDSDNHSVSGIQVIDAATNQEITLENNKFSIPITGVRITGLPNGSYKLVEEEAPAGYIITNSTTTFTVSDGQVTQWSLAGTAGTIFEIPNPPGAALPHTGGPGTMFIYLLGSMLTLAAGLLLMRRRTI